MNTETSRMLYPASVNFWRWFTTSIACIPLLDIAHQRNLRKASNEELGLFDQGRCP
jgi:hypothetical protein